MAVDLHEDKAGVEEMHEQTRDVTDLEIESSEHL